MDVYGRRLIATVWFGLVRRSRLLTYIREGSSIEQSVRVSEIDTQIAIDGK